MRPRHPRLQRTPPHPCRRTTAAHRLAPLDLTDASSVYRFSDGRLCVSLCNHVRLIVAADGTLLRVLQAPQREAHER